MSRRAYVVFLVATTAWLAVAVIAWGRSLESAAVWWGLLVMLLAAGYYVIQEAPAARVSGWLGRDLLVNGALLAALSLAVLDGAGGFGRLGLGGAGWTAFAAAVVHPLAVDLPHRRHHRRDPAGSPIPQYVPPACVWIDWTLAALLLAALLR